MTVPAAAIFCMVLITLGYANSADELQEADLRDAQWRLEQQMAEEDAASAGQGMVRIQHAPRVVSGAPALTRQQ